MSSKNTHKATDDMTRNAPGVIPLATGKIVELRSLASVLVKDLERQVMDLQFKLAAAAKDIGSLLRLNEDRMGAGLINNFEFSQEEYRLASTFSPHAARALDVAATTLPPRESACPDKI